MSRVHAQDCGAQLGQPPEEFIPSEAHPVQLLRIRFEHQRMYTWNYADIDLGEVVVLPVVPTVERLDVPAMHLPQIIPEASKYRRRGRQATTRFIPQDPRV